MNQDPMISPMCAIESEVIRIGLMFWQVNKPLVYTPLTFGEDGPVIQYRLYECGMQDVAGHATVNNDIACRRIRHQSIAVVF